MLINVLELRAVLASVNWRARSVRNVHSQSLQLVDSSVALGALARGRSSSERLAPVVTKIDAVCLAASLTFLLGWIRTDLNPADAASRSHGGQA